MSHLLKTHYGGWNPQAPDQRDHQFLHTAAAQTVPVSMELDTVSIPILDQGAEGSCTGHGPCVLVMYDQVKQSEPVVVPSRAMVYYDARIPEGTTDQDSGATVRDSVAGIAKYGVCPDSEFPYSDQVFNVAPGSQAYADAKQQEALAYEAVYYPHLNQAIASGYPIAFGFTVYESFESASVASTGIVPIPGKGEQVIGRHCVALTGYNSGFTDTIGKIPPRTKRCRNSWGAGWGDNGDFYLPQWFFDTGQAADFWVIRRVGPPSTI